MITTAVAGVPIGAPVGRDVASADSTLIDDLMALGSAAGRARARHRRRRTAGWAYSLGVGYARSISPD